MGTPEGPRRPQSEILEEVDRFALSIESLPNAAVLVEADGKIALVNAVLERLFGFSARGADRALHRDAAAGCRPRGPRDSGSRGGSGAQEPEPDLLGRRHDGSLFPVEIGCASVSTKLGPRRSRRSWTSRRDVGAEDASNQRIVSQLEFEWLVADLSVRFINLPPIKSTTRCARLFSELVKPWISTAASSSGLNPMEWHFLLLGGNALASRRLRRRSAARSAPWVLERLVAGELVSFSTVDEIPNPVDRATYESLGVRSSVTVPLLVEGRLMGAVGFNMFREERSWSPDVLHRLRVFATAFGNVLARRESDEALHNALDEVRRLRDRLDAENQYLRAEVKNRIGTGAIVGQSAALRRVLEQAEQVAQTDSTVLLLGETGTGKELFASRIHELSARRGRSMVRVNCSAIPATLMESELFGREKGAFTGALARQIGRFELADHSTIFLDEIGDLPPEIQVKLLRVLEERQIERLGSPKGIYVDVRVSPPRIATSSGGSPTAAFARICSID